MCKAYWPWGGLWILLWVRWESQRVLSRGEMGSDPIQVFTGRTEGQTDGQTTKHLHREVFMCKQLELASKRAVLSHRLVSACLPSVVGLLPFPTIHGRRNRWGDSAPPRREGASALLQPRTHLGRAAGNVCSLHFLSWWEQMWLRAQEEA